MGGLTSAYGLTPDPWQQTILNAWLGRDENDKYTATTCGLAVPRQNGKNALLEMRELYGLTVIGERILHTAHEVKTARKAFIRLAGFFENDRQYPELAEMVNTIRRTNGQEAIELTNGATIEFSARSRGAARGFTVDLVVFDEAQELTDEQLEAMLPTLSASPLGNRQFIYTGTPPGPNSPGTVFGRTRENSIKQVEEGMCWHEWSVEDVGDVFDRERWYETNPAMGYRIDEDFTGKELASMSPDGFARERLGWWASKRGKAVIKESDWSQLVTNNPPEGMPPEGGKIVFGVKFDPDGVRASIVAAITSEDRPPYIELVEQYQLGSMEPMIELLLNYPKIASLVLIDGRSHADNFYEDLANAGYPKKGLKLATVNEVISANSRLLTAVENHDLIHYGQEQLTEAALNAQKRPIGDKGGWGFQAYGGDDITPVEAAALALQGVMTTKRNPARKTRIL